MLLNFFSSQLTLMQNKLECLSFARFFPHDLINVSKANGIQFDITHKHYTNTKKSQDKHTNLFLLTVSDNDINLYNTDISIQCFITFFLRHNSWA